MLIKTYFAKDGEQEGGNPTTFTEEQVKAKVDEAIAEATKKNDENFQKRLNEAEKGIRLKLEKEAEKAKLSAEEQAKLEIKEKMEAIERENQELKTEKNRLYREKAIADNQLPTFYNNDIRVINATQEEMPNIIKALKKENADYVASIGKVSTNTTPLGGSTIGSRPLDSLTREEWKEVIATKGYDEYNRLQRQLDQEQKQKK